MNFTKHVIPIIVIPIVLVSFLLYGKFSESYKQASLEKNITKFIQIKGMDELVITEITGNENYSDSACTKYISTFGIGCVGRGSVNVVFDAHYKYYVKLDELKYTIEDDTLIFKVPDLYLSKPVGYDNQSVRCDTTIFGSCGEPYGELLPKIPKYLEEKGKLGLQNAYENAAKSLADNFFEFAKNNNALFFKKISVIFCRIT